MRRLLLLFVFCALAACAPSATSQLDAQVPMHRAPAPGEVSEDWMRVRQAVGSSEVTYKGARPDRAERVARSVISSERKMSLDVREIPVALALERVARVAGLKLVTENVSGTITLSVKGAPVRRVFEQIVAARGLRVVRIGEVVIVSGAS